MAQLVQSFVGDTALRLQDEEFVRTMAFGYNWKRINIAVNHSAPQFNGTVGVANTGYYIGLCEGSTNTFKSTTCTEWVGCYIFSTGYNYTAGPPAGIQPSGGGNWRRGYKIGNTLTESGADSVSNYIGVTNRDYWYFTIEQTTAGYNVYMRTPSAVPTVDRFGRDFELIINQTEQDTIRAINFATNRRLDTLSIYWTLPSVGIELNEVLVTRIA